MRLWISRVGVVVASLALSSCWWGFSDAPLATNPPMTPPGSQLPPEQPTPPEEKSEPEIRRDPNPLPPSGSVPVARRVPGRDGFVFSPFNNKLVDVAGFPSGALVADPHYPASEKKYFKVP